MIKCIVSIHHRYGRVPTLQGSWNSWRKGKWGHEWSFQKKVESHEQLIQQTK